VLAKRSANSILFLAYLFVCQPIHAAKSISVADLTTLVEKDAAAKKTDEQVAGDLKDLDLIEQLTSPAYNALIALKPGPRTIEQLTVLLYSSALKPLPNAPPIDRPVADAAEQKAIVDKLQTYLATSFTQLPKLTATKTVMRFDDTPLSMQQDFRLAQGNGTATSNMLSSRVGNFTRYHGATTTPVQIIQGTESAVKGKLGLAADPQGPIFTEEFGALLPLVVKQATTVGKLEWQKWDTINGLQVGVFAFAVEKKQSRYQLKYCCFADYDVKGGGVTPMMSAVEWKPFAANEPYHGLLYVEPKTGSVLRMILQADMKQSDNIHQEDTRVEYATVTLGGKPYLMPKEQITLTRVVVSGENSGHTYTEVRNIYSISYSGFQLLP